MGSHITLKLKCSFYVNLYPSFPIQAETDILWEFSSRKLNLEYLQLACLGTAGPGQSFCYPQIYSSFPGMGFDFKHLLSRREANLSSIDRVLLHNCWNNKVYYNHYISPAHNFSEKLLLKQIDLKFIVFSAAPTHQETQTRNNSSFYCVRDSLQ